MSVVSVYTEVVFDCDALVGIFDGQTGGARMCCVAILSVRWLVYVENT